LVSLVSVLVTPGRLWGAETCTVDPGTTHQTMEGFGASLHYYDNWVTAHPNKEEIYSLIFHDLGLDILRLGNTYRGNPTGFAVHAQEIVAKLFQYSPGAPIVMITSWSPPASLKSNGSTANGGTLIRTNGEYAYEAFADYWADSLAAYATLGITPTYISIQNEPSYQATWDSCLLSASETATVAGYPQALAAVAERLQVMDSPPTLLGPEVLGIGYNLLQSYLDNLDRDLLAGYAHHLYHGGTHTDPDSFVATMETVADQYADKPIFQTEFGGSTRGDWFQTAWVIHNALVHEGVAAYLYWDLVWDGAGLVSLENPWYPHSWQTTEGYVVTDLYYAFQQYARYVHRGWKRIDAQSSSPQLRVSAFISPQADAFTVVVLNVGEDDVQLDLNIGSFSLTGAQVVRTSDEEHGEWIMDWDGVSTISLPSRSVSTVAADGTVKAANSWRRYTRR